METSDNKKKLIIIHCSPLTKRWYKYYCYEKLITEFDLEYWDCSNFVYPHFIANDSIKDSHISKILNIDELRSKLQNSSPHAIIVMDIHRSEKNFKVLQLISHFYRKIVYIDFFSNTIRPSILKRLINYIHFKTIRERFFYTLYQMMFTTTRISCKNDSIYRINHPDYETFLELKNIPPILPNKRYIVYVDNNYPFHPEIQFREPSFNPNKAATLFYNSLNIFFEKVEKQYNCSIVIAAHPAANYPTNPYGGRLLIPNKTGLLVRDSIGVLLHTSNAISFAYLYKKPTAHLCNSGYMLSKGEYKRLLECSYKLKNPIVNTDISDGKNIFKDSKTENESEKYISEYLTDINDQNPNSIKLVRYLQDIGKIANL